MRSRLAFCKLFGLLFLFFSADAVAVQAVPVFGAAREIVMPAFQFSKLASDLPISAAVIDEGDALWLAGKQSIWRWHLKSNQLQKINLVKDAASGPLRDLVIHQDSIFAMTDHDLFQVKFNPLQAVRLKSNNIETSSVGMTPGGKQLYWITSKGVYATDPVQKSLMYLGNSPTLAPGDQAVFVWETGALWYTQGDKLYLRNLVADKASSKLIVTAKDKLRRLYRSGSDIFVHTKFSVVRYDLEGKLLQTIPVEGERKLVLMNLSDAVHSYLFSDKLLEMYQLESKKTLRYQLDIGRVQEATRMVTHQSMVGLVLDGKPRAFQLSGNW